MTEVNDQQGTGPELGLFPLGKTLLFAGVVYREMEAGPRAGGAAMQYLTPGSLPVRCSATTPNHHGTTTVPGEVFLVEGPHAGAPHTELILSLLSASPQVLSEMDPDNFFLNP